MPVVTKIEAQKNKARVNIFVDDAFFCGLNKETAVIFGLKVGKEVDESKLQKMIFESETKSAFEKATDYLASRIHTKKELIDKLTKKQYSKDVILNAIEKLEEYHYVDDEQFAKLFVSQNTKLSKRMLIEKLRIKGVEKSIIDEVVSGIESDSELESCMLQVQKYIKSKQINTAKDLQKLYASLARKGFGFNTIKKACSKFENFSDYDENYDC